VAAEIETASRREALAEARTLLEAAVARARQLGLRGDALRAFVGRLLAREPGPDPRVAPEKGQADGRD
jgi:hypothetical protein